MFLTESNSTVPKNATAQGAIGLAIEQAKEKGANAIINLKYEYIPSYKNAPYGWAVTGMAIKK